MGGELKAIGGGPPRVLNHLLTMLTPPEFSALHIPSSGAIPIVVPLNVTPLREEGHEKEQREQTNCELLGSCPDPT